MPEFPSQTENRRFWILETIRENQSVVAGALQAILEDDYDTARLLLNSLYGLDRRAILNREGILLPEQIARLQGLDVDDGAERA